MRRMKLVLFGMGDLFEKTVKYLNYAHVEVVAIADNDPQKHGKVYKGIKTISAEEICNIDYDCVVISNAAYYQQITKQLKGLGVTHILPLYKNDKNKKQKRIQSYILNSYGKIMMKYREERIKQSFEPDMLGLWFNSYYFSRKELLDAIKRNAHYIYGKCMDFGCGDLPYESLFNVKEYVGVEIECDNKKKGIVYYDGHHIPFEDCEFDCIISSQVFEHVPNLDEIICELNRVLKKGGYMLLTVPFVHPEHLAPNDYRRFTSYGIRLFLEENGFCVVQQEKSGSYVKAIFQMKNVCIAENSEAIILKDFMCFVNNIKGLLLSKLVHTNHDLYLDNIIIAQKK